MNSQHLTDHLTGAQLTECLTAEFPEPAIQSHLAQCDACRMELGVFMAAMDDFSHAAMGWSKAQPVISPRARQPRLPSWWFAPVGWAVAAGLVLAVGIPVSLHREHAAVVTVARVSVEDSPAQIAQDNQLLLSVDQALAASEPSPMQEYGLALPRKGSR